MNIPQINSKWKHTSGTIYSVIMLTNEQTTKPEQYPVTVVYKDANGHIWSRPLSDWHRSMVKV